jgi:hypothetical protein
MPVLLGQSSFLSIGGSGVIISSNHHPAQTLFGALRIRSSTTVAPALIEKRAN